MPTQSVHPIHPVVPEPNRHEPVQTLAPIVIPGELPGRKSVGNANKVYRRQGTLLPSRRQSHVSRMSVASDSHSLDPTNVIRGEDGAPRPNAP